MKLQNTARPPARGKITGLLKYATKVCGVGQMLKRTERKAPGKSYAASSGLEVCLVGLMTGATSARQIEERGQTLRSKDGGLRSPSRNTIGGLLNETRTSEAVRDAVEGLLDVIRNLRIDRRKRFGGMRAAALDGIDLGEIDHGDKPCPHCLRRETKIKDPRTGAERVEVSHYHFKVVLDLLTKAGPIPIGYELARTDEVDARSTSAEQTKQDCEAKIAKRLLGRIAEKHRGRLPFELLFTDALHGNAPFMEMVESLGCVAVSVLKDERRSLWQEADAEFEFGLNPGIKETSWKKRGPDGRKRSFDAESIILEDGNRQGANKEVTITRITRSEADGQEAVNTFISTSSKALTPKVIEALRFAKWGELENRTFNTLTNGFGILKHLFFHRENALTSVLGLGLLVLAITNLYRLRNLRRGGRRAAGTLKQFLERMYADLSVKGQWRRPIWSMGP